MVVRCVNSCSDGNHYLLAERHRKMFLALDWACRFASADGALSGIHMEKIPAVETAKELMTEAVAWSVMRWLREKKTVRKIADQANAALDELNLAVKERWPHEARAAYDDLAKQTGGNNKARSNHGSVPSDVSPQIVVNAKKVKEANDEAYRARMEAEDTFDTAEKQLSTALAREGCRKAIRSWELYERAIRKAEALISSH